MATYKIANVKNGTIPGVGQVKDHLITTNEKLEGPNIQEVNATEQTAAAPAPQAQQPVVAQSQPVQQPAIQPINDIRLNTQTETN